MRMYNATAVATGSLIGGAVSTNDTRLYVRESDTVRFYSLTSGLSGEAPYQGDFAPISGGVVTVNNGELTYEIE